MHPTALKNGRLFFENYVKNPGVLVVDIGAQDVNGSLRSVCPPYAHYIGVDCVAACGVDVILDDPYSLPFHENSIDVVVSSSCFEHSEMFWLLFLEVLRVLKPEGLFYLNVPSSWSFHRSPVDCYRFFPDSGNALAKWGKRNGFGATVLEHYTNYSDYVCIFLKDEEYALKYPNRIIHSMEEFSCGGLYPDLDTIYVSAAENDKHKLFAPHLFKSEGEQIQEFLPKMLQKQISEQTWRIIDFVKPYTMTTAQRVANVVNAVDYIIKNNISGAFVECGVWRGGCSMAAACALLLHGSSERELYLYDTFEGMSPPCEYDVRLENGTSAAELLAIHGKDLEDHIWAYAPLHDVVSNLRRTTYPESKISYVKGKVEETMPNTLPGHIAILRLDTDWYQSTLHELVHLYPLLKKGGVLIIDDYGCWAGAKKAVDEYFADIGIKPDLIRIIDDCGSSAYYAIKF